MIDIFVSIYNTKMGVEFPDRFRFPDGRPKNGYWIYKDGLKPGEKYICERIVKVGGILGRSTRSLKAAHIRQVDVQNLVRDRILKTDTLGRIARKVIKNRKNRTRRMELESEGGYLSLGIDSRDRKFIHDFDTAVEIVTGESNLNPKEVRYLVAVPVLHDYIEGIVVG